MKNIEEIKKDEGKSKRKYWFPFPVGINRLLLTISILLACFVGLLNGDFFFVFAIMFFVLIEIPMYMVIIWIYHGFIDYPQKNE